MIRLIQRRLIIPRGDTGTFTVPALSPGQSDSVGVFTIFDPITKTRVFQKQVELQDGVFNIEFDHGDTVNLQAGDYLWDIKFYVNPIIENGKVIDGTEIDSYYAAFQTPKCEIRETGDDFMVIDGQPAKIEDLNIILAATSAANAAKVAATEQAEIAATKASEAAERLAQMIAAIPTKVSELENDSGYLQEETDPTVPAWAKAAEKPSYTPQEVGALPSDTFIPSKVSDLTDDSGHYIKPASGIPASDLEETYLTEHQDISMKANSADLAAVATSGSYNDLEDKPTIPEVPVQDVQIEGTSIIQNSVANIPLAVNGVIGVVKTDPTGAVGVFTNATPGNSYGKLIISSALNDEVKAGKSRYKPIVPRNQHESVFYGLSRAAGANLADEENITVGTYPDSAKTAIQQMLDVPSTADIPTKVSQLQNDSGYLTSFTETDPTVPAWAKEPTKPTYTAAEVNAVNKTGDTMTGTLTLPYINQSYRNALRFATNADAHEMGINARYDENYDYGYFTVSSELKSGFTKDAIIRGVKNPRYSNDAANKEYVDNKISTAIGNINSFDMAVVQELPTQDISTHTIYLVPKTGETNDVYDEYVYINSAWEMVGNTQIDLSNYALKSELPTRVSDLTNDAGYLTTHQDISGKANTADLATVATSGNYNDLSNKPTIPEVPVQDVQVNGVSVLQDGVANVPIVSAYGNTGVVKIVQYRGLDFEQSTGALTTQTASDIHIKGGVTGYAVIDPLHQHQATFYGLAKAAGDTTQSQSNNSVGSYTNTAKGAIQKMLGITDLIAPEENDLVANQAYAIGDVFIANGKLYKATAAIAVDGAIITDGANANCEETSVGEGFVKFTDYATSSTAGVVKVNNANGIGITGNTLYLYKATDNSVKIGTEQYKALTPYSQHIATFYGLSKAAGVDMASSENAVGTYTDTAKTAIRTMLGATSNNVIAVQDTQPTDTDTKIWLPKTAPEGVEVPTMADMNAALAEKVNDVQVNGTSVVSNGIASIPIAQVHPGTNDDYGLVKINSNNGITISSDGCLSLVRSTETGYKTANDNYKVITPYGQHLAVFYGLAKASGDTTQSASSNAVGSYTDNAKASIKAMLGIQDGSTGTVDISGATPTITAVENTRYVCGEVTSLSFTPPASGISIVRFTSGSTVTVLTIPSTVKFPEWFDSTSLETNTIYEICVTDGVYGAVMSWAL